MDILVYFFAFLKYVIYGMSVFFTGELSANVDFLDILALRFLMSALVLWILKITRAVKINIGVKDFLKKNDRTRFLKPLLLSALFEPVLYMFFETLGISMTTGITAGVILSLNPVASCISESLILKERSTAAQKIFLGLGIVGVIYIAAMTDTSGGEDSFLGILFITVAVITGALYLTFSRKSSKHFSAMEITYVSTVLGALAFNAVNIVRHLIVGDILHYFDPYFDLGNLWGFFFLAVISTIIATGLNNFALSKLQVSTMAAFSGLSTVVTIIASVIIGGERIYYYHIIGMALIVARMLGVSYIQIKRDREKNNITTEEKDEIS